jgi:hypothetical protein
MNDFIKYCKTRDIKMIIMHKINNCISTRTEDTYYDEYEEEELDQNTQEHWVYEADEDSPQFQAINCYGCGDYISSSNRILPSNIECKCNKYYTYINICSDDLEQRVF